MKGRTRARRGRGAPARPEGAAAKGGAARRKAGWGGLPCLALLCLSEGISVSGSKGSEVTRQPPELAARLLCGCGAEVAVWEPPAGAGEEAGGGGGSCAARGRGREARRAPGKESWCVAPLCLFPEVGGTLARSGNVP